LVLRGCTGLENLRNRDGNWLTQVYLEMALKPVYVCVHVCLCVCVFGCLVK